MDHTLPLTFDTDLGVTVRLAHGALAVLLGYLDPARLLIMHDGCVHEIPMCTVTEHPALCARCRQARWWWNDDHRPCCLRCERPDTAWREQTWAHAQAIVVRTRQRTAASDSPWARIIFNQVFTHGGCWDVLQRFAFAEEVASPVAVWHEQGQR